MRTEHRKRQHPKDGHPDRQHPPHHLPINQRKVYHRVFEVMSHIPWYGFRSQARLAADAGISEAALSRFLAGTSNPSFAMAMAVLTALEKRLGKPLPPREIFSMDEKYPSASVCELLGCKKCSSPKLYETDAWFSSSPATETSEKGGR